VATHSLSFGLLPYFHSSFIFSPLSFSFEYDHNTEETSIRRAICSNLRCTDMLRVTSFEGLEQNVYISLYWLQPLPSLTYAVVNVSSTVSILHTINVVYELWYITSAHSRSSRRLPLTSYSWGFNDRNYMLPRKRTDEVNPRMDFLEHMFVIFSLLLYNTNFILLAHNSSSF
jgi:hypothetical protein